MSLTTESDHAGLIVADLLQTLQGRTRIQAFVEAVAVAVQALEDEQATLIDGSIISATTPLDLLRKWGDIVGEASGALIAADLAQIIGARIGANTIGTPNNPATVTGYLALLVEAFDPSTVAVTMYPDTGSLVMVTVASDVARVGSPMSERGGAIARDAAPIGTLVVVQEYDVDDGLLLDTAMRGLDGPLLGLTLYDGLGG